MAAGTQRDKIVRAAADLFRRKGYAGTGLNDVVTESGAPKGSLYYYFPGGKEELGAEAVRFAGARVANTLKTLAAEHIHAGDLVRAYAQLLAGWMTKSSFRDGCPITTTLLETVPGSSSIAGAGCDAFASWTRILSDALIRDGVDRNEAQRLARFAISALEGALITARTEVSDDIIIEIGITLQRLFLDAVRR